MQNLKRIIFISCFLLSNYVISGACDDYPYGHLEITIKEGSDEGLKIMATAHAAITYDGVVGNLEALVIAEERAKKNLLAWLMQEIRRSCSDLSPPAARFWSGACDLSKKPADVILRGVTKVDMCVQDNQHPRMVAVTVGFSFK